MTGGSSVKGSHGPCPQGAHGGTEPTTLRRVPSPKVKLRDATETSGFLVLWVFDRVRTAVDGGNVGKPGSGERPRVESVPSRGAQDGNSCGWAFTGPGPRSRQVLRPHDRKVSAVDSFSDWVLWGEWDCHWMGRRSEGRRTGRKGSERTGGRGRKWDPVFRERLPTGLTGQKYKGRRGSPGNSSP